MEYKSNKQIAAEWIVGLMILALFIVLIGYGVKTLGGLIVDGVKYAEAKRATTECEKWQDWEKIYPEWDPASKTGYYITEWQKAQCDTYGIELDAHVADYKRD